AVNDYTKVINLKPTAKVYHNRGSSYAQLKDYESAIKDFTKALELSDIESETYYLRGFSYESIDQKEKSVADYEKACKLNYTTACNALKGIKPQDPKKDNVSIGIN
ncbi:MAG: tetratricopeptide repeat protein, partial [Cyanobacteriota bacterium]